jgi:hypothetical protein
MLYLYKDNNPFDFVSNMAGFWGSVYYCHTHKKHYNNKANCSSYKDEERLKRLQKVCYVCSGTAHPPETYFDSEGKITWIECSHCFRFFLNSECFQNHLKTSLKGQSACTTIWKCRKCGKNIKWNERTQENHVCGESKCLNCKEFCILSEHECYMLKKAAKGGNCTKSEMFCCRLFESNKGLVLFMSNVYRKLLIL